MLENINTIHSSVYRNLIVLKISIISKNLRLILLLKIKSRIVNICKNFETF